MTSCVAVPTIKWKKLKANKAVWIIPYQDKTWFRTLSSGENRIRTKTSARASCPVDSWTATGWPRTGFHQRRLWFSSLYSGNAPSLKPESRLSSSPSVIAAGRPSSWVSDRLLTLFRNRNIPDRRQKRSLRPLFASMPLGDHFFAPFWWNEIQFKQFFDDYCTNVR